LAAWGLVTSTLAVLLLLLLLLSLDELIRKRKETSLAFWNTDDTIRRLRIAASVSNETPATPDRENERKKGRKRAAKRKTNNKKQETKIEKVCDKTCVCSRECVCVPVRVRIVLAVALVLVPLLAEAPFFLPLIGTKKTQKRGDLKSVLRGRLSN